MNIIYEAFGGKKEEEGGNNIVKMTREEMIEFLVEVQLGTTWGRTDSLTEMVSDLLVGGFKGYENYTDKDLVAEVEEVKQSQESEDE